MTIIKNKGGGKKSGLNNRERKNDKKKQQKDRQIGSSKGTRHKIKNIEKSQNKRTSKKKNSGNKKSKKGKKGGNYVYFPSKNIIQFLPNNYPNISYNPTKIYNQKYIGKQMGGDVLPKSCSNFSPNTLNREFDCKQPFWNSNCL